MYNPNPNPMSNDHEKRSQPMGKDHVHCVGFYTISCVRGTYLKMASCQLRQICHPVLESSTYGTGIELHKSLIPSCVL